MKNYKNLIYKNLDEYKEVINKLKRDFVIEIDFNKFKKAKDFDNFLATKIDAPAHYFGGLNRLFDLLVDFEEFENPKKMILLIKNFPTLKHIDKQYYRYFLELCDDAIEHHNKMKKGELEVYIFLKK